jgi:hypothetical protein
MTMMDEDMPREEGESGPRRDLERIIEVENTDR